MKRIISVLIILVMIFSMSACDVDFSKFDLTKHNFGLTDDDSDSKSNSDIQSVSDFPEADAITEEIINYVVPENSNVIYNNWTVVPANEFTSMAKDKLLEMANSVSSLMALKEGLSQYTSVNAIAADERFSKALNNIRAWRFGAKNYPSSGLSDDEAEILERLISIGSDSAEYGAKLPSLIVTYNAEMCGTYEELIISQIVSLENIL